jgi:hypothetical protein
MSSRIYLISVSIKCGEIEGCEIIPKVKIITPGNVLPNMNSPIPPKSRRVPPRKKYEALRPLFRLSIPKYEA